MLPHVSFSRPPSSREPCLDDHTRVSARQALRVQIRQLEEAQLKASSRVSNHKEATQLLQTELQDSRAQVEEQHGTIRTLKAKLRQSEVRLSVCRPARQPALHAWRFVILVSLCFRRTRHPAPSSWRNSGLNSSKWRWS